MDLRAVVALAVVLDRDLPVRLELVDMRRTEPEISRAVAVDDDVEVAEMRRQIRGVAARVEEQPTVPLGEPRLDQRELALVERVHVEARGRAQVAAEAVDPRVVGTPDAALRPAFAHGEQLVAAVPADVVERTERAVVAANQQEALRADGHGGLRARRD